MNTNHLRSGLRAPSAAATAPTRPAAPAPARAWLLRAGLTLATTAQFVAITAIVPIFSPYSALAASGDRPDANTVRRAEAIATEAKFLFKQKAYEEAAARFFEAYTLVNQASLLYNAARAYEEAGNLERAAALFRAYVELKDAPADGRADARKRLVPIDAKLAEKAAAEKAAAEKVAAEKAAAEQAAAERQRALAEAQERANAERIAAERAAAQAASERAKTERSAAERTKSDRDRADRDRADRDRAQAAAANPGDVGVRGSANEATTPWLQIGTTAGSLAISGLLYGLALSEAKAAHDMEGDLSDADDKVVYLDHASAARSLQVGAIVGAVVGAGCAGWLVWTLVDGGSASTTAVLMPTSRGGALLVRF